MSGAVEHGREAGAVAPGIGVLNERSLHGALKRWCARPGDLFETAVDGFVIDIVRNDRLLEVQTGNFTSIKSKLNRLVRSHPIRLIYPIAREKWIVKLAQHDRRPIARHKSPRRGRVEDLFWEMVRLPQLLSKRNFSLEVLMIQEEEVRRYKGRGRWRRRGWGVEERRLLTVLEKKVFETPADWLALLPDGLESFTTSDLAAATGMRRKLAQKMAYCLCKGGLIELVGKQGRANLYRVPDARRGASVRAERSAAEAESAAAPAAWDG